ncbi:hypothetical protein ACLI1A_03915 [Flavobacterium sp. RHBU_3]|uniref:hypothetical protein n=1 Tax=Flavobacterium sp. RHBU_3 TaxID=3391184 RepID=UPI0039854C87
MKSFIYVAVAVLFSTTIAFAQATTATTLQGEWKVDAVNFSGINYNINTGKVLLLDASLTQGQEVTEDDLNLLAAQVKEQLAPFSGNSFTFTKDGVKIKLGYAERSGKFALTQKETKNYIEASFEDKGVKEFQYNFKNNQLYVYLPDESGADIQLVFKRV